MVWLLREKEVLSLCALLKESRLGQGNVPSMGWTSRLGAHCLGLLGININLKQHKLPVTEACPFMTNYACIQHHLIITVTLH